MFKRTFMTLCFLAAALLPAVPLRAATADDYYRAGLNLYQQQQDETALKYFQAAVQLDPNHWRAYQAMGHAQYRMGDKQAALASYDKSLAINAENPQLRQFADTLRGEAGSPAPEAAPAPGPSASRAEGSGKWFSWGIKGGASLANVSVSPESTETPGPYESFSESNGTKVGFVHGVFFTFGLSPSIAIQPELLQVSKGYKYQYDYSASFGGFGSTDHETTSYTIDYLEIPVLLKFYVSERKFAFFAGPSLAIMTGATSWTEYSMSTTTPLGTDSDSGDYGINMKDRYKSTDFGLNFGAAYESAHWILEARYNLGMGDIYKLPDGFTPPPGYVVPKWKNNTILIMTGVKFG